MQTLNSVVPRPCSLACLFKILTKPCPPQKLSAAINAAISAKNGDDQQEDQAPEGVL